MKSENVEDPYHLHIGDTVYIRATVSDLPNEYSNMYRIVTKNEGTVIWCTGDELAKIYL